MVGVYVKDQDRAVDFYTSKLGFQVVEDAPMGGGARWLVVAPPGGETRLVLFTPPGMEDRIGTFSNILFTCADVRATYQELRARGVTFLEEPTEQPWGIMAQFLDADGNRFLLATDA
jgi:predicted enzyme related to lactoylglutathione lyase